MSYEDYSQSQFYKAVLKSPEMFGPSPGGAAGLLGVSRQRVHQLIDTGKLRAYRVDGDYIYLNKIDLQNRLEYIDQVDRKTRRVASNKLVAKKWGVR
jgi:excisionase family DNA binding protein